MPDRTLLNAGDDVHPLVRAAFYAFVFSIPLEYPERSIPLEIHTITGALFLVVALIQPRICFRRPPAAFWWLAAYLWVYIALTLFAEHSREAMKLFLNYLLVLFIFWVAYNLMRRAALARRACIAFAAACTLIATLSVYGIATHTVVSDQTLRRIVFGQDPNLLGGNMALALVAVIALGFAVDTSLWAGAVWGAVGVMLGRSLMLSGSRGAFIAVGIGVLAFALHTRDIRTFAKHLGVARRGVAVLTAVVYRSESLWRRYERTLQTGSMSGREQIYPEAWQMFTERPVFGWGPIDNTYELGLRTAIFTIGRHNREGRSLHADKDTHNLLLDVLTSTGVAGAAPLCICLALCIAGAWKGRAGPHGTMPFALAVTLLALSMNANWSASKQGWVMLAFAAASGRAWFRPDDLRLTRAD
jgi:O-antigen ligase